MASVVAHSPSTPFNLTFKLGSLLTLPSRFLARIRLIDEFLSQDSGRNAVTVSWGPDGPHSAFSSTQGTPFPGPWGFLTSGYAFVLFAMAVLLHRIQNIVVPPQRPLVYDHRRRSTSLIRLIYHSILPLDLSSTTSRLVFYLPSLYFLLRVLLLWTVILLQTAQLFPLWDWNWLQELGQWAAEMPMDDICWRTFCAVCGASCIETLVRGLEGTGTNGNLSPFNLHGYAFLLHIYASPLTHAVSNEGLPSRPDKHVIITMTIPLLQLVMLHVLGIRKKLSHHRLIPTGIATVVSLAHFHAVLWTSPSSYPLLNYVTCVLESFLVAVTLLTVSLNALTQILLEGTITRPLFKFADASTIAPKWDEDFSLALLRIGVASLEATSVAGLGNEVGGVVVTDKPSPQVVYGTVEMNRTGVVSIFPAVERRRRGEKVRSGFANEIRNVKTGSGQRDIWDKSWYKGLARFTIALWRCLKGVSLLGWDIVRGRPCLSLRRHNGALALDRDESESILGGVGEEKANVYARFLNGEDISDDEDDEGFEPSTPVDQSSSNSDDVDESDDGSATEESENETMSLYADLSSATSTPVPASFLLAHMTSPSASPLTRRRYDRLVTAPWEERGGLGSLDGWPDGGHHPRRRRGSVKLRHDDGGGDGVRQNCVVCTVEARQIICWPCRCLSLCDGCRENLAAQSAASKHRCPCCRRNVEGYSKIFIP